MSIVGEFGLTSCGHLSNMLFIMVAIIAVYTLLFYKAQSVAYVMLPSESFENTINRYIILTFLLKVSNILKI